MNIFATFGSVLLLIVLLGLAIVILGFAISAAIVLIRSALRWQPKDRVEDTPRV